eukprot:GHUV01020032.1.p1 GENE.GHUV01020032.1~~GHUV01020032.1.p1  ORF type:complete len:146 (+),score=17.94 GHUV01020032.1:399-836(+)
MHRLHLGHPLTCCVLLHPLPLPAVQPGVGLAAEHGFFIRPPWKQRWHSRFPLADHSWQAMVMPILKQVRGANTQGLQSCTAVLPGTTDTTWYSCMHVTVTAGDCTVPLQRSCVRCCDSACAGCSNRSRHKAPHLGRLYQYKFVEC